ncbi:MAG TPA: EAL domain-containing protein [Accumulibacter sp.]|uniref:EAL domain-containing protein n=1 Tax=Accumulibacter sp. TaxID=2053492 RepID=UPI0026049AAC|nr:EAL domain-containing protein [Accumulibacter sp.]HMV04963.1 EAL domain-containing protein [Accumulibacter sp.]HMX68774.1 EAL domain-containing protein [Accumulibacter sp.]HNB66922.1 EAL domain-containing protein [Accumulibacter sp.]HNG16192.1 EAL domain-containing protein [Accumulibacter sp.]HNH91039.1 EAL domain-containing protein [Accumulibacter sp.]
MSNANQDEAKKGRPSSRRAPPVGASADNEGAHARSDERPFIVGIGASAGGLEALSLLLPGLPKNLGLTYVVVQHLSPTYRSMMSQLLGRETTMPVKDIEDGALPEANTVYITPPNRNLTLLGGCFRLVEPARESMPKPSVNRFFASLAEEIGESTIGIILSGTGSDGAAGIHAIKAAGGFTFAQDPDTAKYSGMPQSAIDTGSVDWILPPESMGAEISLIVLNRGLIPVATQAASAPATLKTLLGKVRARTRVDFSQYKEPTLWRRIERRMAANHVSTLHDYLQVVDQTPVELDKLCKDILISVTAFFRDTDAFARLDKVVAEILAGKQPGDDIRVWVAGCATGEEAYSLAILFAERLGAAFDQYRLQIFATDIDLDAMALARRGVFAASSLAHMDRGRIRAHFTPHGDRYEINKILRDVVIFARQDLVQDPPFLRLDLVSCRNVLIYFQSELQARLLSVFHYALNPGGYLFLGKSEGIFQQEALFGVVDKDGRLYRRHGVSARLPLLRAEMQPPAAGMNQHLRAAKPTTPLAFENILLEAAGRYFIPTSILINGKFEIRHIHGDTSRLLNVAPGKPAFDLLSLIRRELRTEVQVLMRQAQVKQLVAYGRPRHIKALDPGRGLRLSVHPLSAIDSEALFMVCIEWIQPTAGRGAVEDSNTITDKELEDELAATREHLQTLVEELETSNEEMQALNEEIQASNEEMQASNEELEASNEELQSTNEELATVNEELQIKTAETQELNVELECIQNSVDYPLLVLDRNLSLQRFNSAAARVFKLAAAQSGRHLRDLPLPAGMPDLVARSQQVIETQEAFDCQIVNANRRHYALHIVPLLRDTQRVIGVILLFADNTSLYEVERSARETQVRLLAVMNNSISLMAVKDSSGRYQFANPRFEATFGFAAGQAIGKTDGQLFPAEVCEIFRESEIAAMRQRQGVEREEALPLRDGPRHFLAVRFPLLDDDGAITGLCFQATDITARKQAEDSLRLAAMVFERASEGVMVTDTEQRILTVNDAFTALTGYTREEVVGQSPSLLRSHLTSPELYRDMWERINRLGVWQGEIWNRRKNGELFLEWLSINTVKDASGEVINYVGMFSDITKARESQQRIEYLATHDELTGLPNRALFNDRLQLALARAERQSESMGVVFIDLDDFKVVNDTLGHPTGDRLLKQAAMRLLDCVRAEDTVARLGGDEFVVLLETSDRKEATRTAQRLLNALSTSYCFEEHECFVSASIGLSMFPEDASDAGALMRKADSAMYRAKDHGKNAFRFFTADLARHAARRLTLETGLRRAIDSRELTVHYQPQVSFSSQQVIGAEALVRWACNGEAVEPVEFIPVAEQSSVIVALDEWVLGEVCRQIVRWDQAGLPPVRVSVNVSARHFRKEGMAADLMQIVSAHGVAPQRLCVEITEGVLMDVERAERMLADLVAHGLTISIDDFGTGFSSLSYLKRFPIHELKIARSFVNGIARSADDRAIGSAIITLARNMGMSVVAEGVELAEQHAELDAAGCHYGQGFLYSPPLAADDFARWLQVRRAV